MIDDVLAFLEGRTDEVRGRLRERMAHASGGLQYERAAQLRDALKWLDQVERPQAVELVGGGDADVVGFARDGDDAVGVVLRVRDGKLVTRSDRFLENLGDAPDEAVLSVFLVRHYMPAEVKARTVVLPFEPADYETFAHLLPNTSCTVPRRGAKWRLLQLADQNARHLLESFRIESFETDERAEDPVYALGRDLGLTVVPRKIACVDISTNQGRDTVGSLVWFEAGRPKKSEYRKFTIRGADAPQSENAAVTTPGEERPDDYAAISEVVTRYVSRRIAEEKPLPDLLVIDGGKGQLGAALDALRQLGTELALASLAKRQEEVFLPGRAESIRLPARAPSIRLLQRLRDEAHRFAVTFNRARRTKRTITSEILNIPGVGNKRRRALLERFGSLAGVRLATPNEIASLPGFSLKLADRILNHVRS